MIGWLRRLFTGEPDCRHEYTEVQRIPRWVRPDMVLSLVDQPIGWKCLLKCKKCGWVCKRIL